MKATLKQNDARDADTDMLVTDPDRHLRLPTILAVCAIFGVCVALLALATHWTLEPTAHHAAAVALFAAASVSSDRPKP